MKKSIAYVFQGFLALSEAEKNEFIEKIEDFKKYPHSTKDNLQKSINESFSIESRGISLGPSPNACTCCGK